MATIEGAIEVLHLERKREWPKGTREQQAGVALPGALEEPGGGRGGAYRARVTYRERRPINNPQPMV